MPTRQDSWAPFAIFAAAGTLIFTFVSASPSAGLRPQAVGAVSAQSALLMHWNFDAMEPTVALDAAGGLKDKISGKFTPVGGVAGKAIRLDGYTFCLERPAKQVPPIGGSFTVDAWVAQAAYPWNWAPVVTQMKAGVNGFTFAVGTRGQFMMELVINDEPYRCVSDDFVLPLRQWTHIAAVVKDGEGIFLYLNGKPAGRAAVTKTFRQAKDIALRVGQGYAPVKPSNQIGDHGTAPFWYTVDGILDEVRVFGDALSGDRLQAYVDGLGGPAAPDLPARKMPTGPPGGKEFGAFYTKLAYYPEWDALWPVGEDPDIVVTFAGSPVKVVFWRGTRYSPAWISETGLWMADQSVEAWDDKEGCFEHMEDPKCLYSHVRIIENTPSRVVVHWRYAPVSAFNHFWQVNEKTGWGVWVDEYYYIYPDATAIRKVGWNTDALGLPRQFQESLPFTDPGQKQGDVIEKDWVTVANLKGETQTLSYIPNPPAKTTKTLPEKPNIQRHNLTSKFDPFIVFEPGNRMNYLNDRDIASLSSWGSCNHWPVGEPNCDGRRVQAGDRPTHFLGFPISTPMLHEANNRSWWAGLYGMTDKPIADLVRLGRAWIRPAAVTAAKGGAAFVGFDTPEKAFVFDAATAAAGPLGWTWEASSESPLVRPVVILKNARAGVKGVTIDGRRLVEGRDYTLGEVRRLEGRSAVLWLNFESEGKTSIEILR
jgi:hypothetical protein